MCQSFKFQDLVGSCISLPKIRLAGKFRIRQEPMGPALSSGNGYNNYRYNKSMEIIEVETNTKEDQEYPINQF